MSPPWIILWSSAVRSLHFFILKMALYGTTCDSWQWFGFWRAAFDEFGQTISNFLQLMCSILVAENIRGVFWWSTSENCSSFVAEIRIGNLATPNFEFCVVEGSWSLIKTSEFPTEIPNLCFVSSPDWPRFFFCAHGTQHSTRGTCSFHKIFSFQVPLFRIFTVIPLILFGISVVFP